MVITTGEAAEKQGIGRMWGRTMKEKRAKAEDGSSVVRRKSTIR
jgi:hypothetical protein